MKRVVLTVTILIGLAAPVWVDLRDGHAAYNRGDYVMALREWELAAKNGDVRAQFLLGSMCEGGTDVAQDYTEAMHWYRKAAEQGFIVTQNMTVDATKRPVVNLKSKASPTISEMRANWNKAGYPDLLVDWVVTGPFQACEQHNKDKPYHFSIQKAVDNAHDLNGDGRHDFLLDADLIECPGWYGAGFCGVGGFCTLAVFLSNKDGSWMIERMGATGGYEIKPMKYWDLSIISIKGGTGAIHYVVTKQNEILRDMSNYSPRDAGMEAMEWRVKSYWYKGSVVRPLK